MEIRTGLASRASLTLSIGSSMSYKLKLCMEVQALIKERSTVVFTRSSSPSYVRNSACDCTYVVQDTTVYRLFIINNRNSIITKSLMLWNNNRTALRLKISVSQNILSVFTARRYAKARSLLSSGVRLSVHPPVSLSVCLTRWCFVSTRLKLSSNFIFIPVAPSL